MNTHYGRSDGIRTHDYRKKYCRITRLERFVILCIFFFLRLPSSAPGGGRLRHLVPHIGSGPKKRARGRIRCYQKKKTVDTKRYQRFFLVGVTGFEPTTSWSRTKRSTKLSHTPIFSAVLNTADLSCYYTISCFYCQPHIKSFYRFIFDILSENKT